MNIYGCRKKLWKRIKQRIKRDYPYGKELVSRVRVAKSKSKNALILTVVNRKDKKAMIQNYLPIINKYLRNKIKVRFVYNKTWKPLLQAFYKSGSILKLFLFFLILCGIIITLIISLSKKDLAFAIIFWFFINFVVDFHDKVLIPFMSFYRNLTYVFESGRDALKPEMDQIAKENIKSPKYSQYDYQWDSYDGIEWFLSSPIINDYLKTNALNIAVRMKKRMATFPEEAKNYLALVISTKLKENKKIFNKCLIGLNDDFDLNMTQIELKKTDYFSYVSIDEMIYKTIRSKHMASYELDGSVFSVSKTGHLYDMKNAICTNLIGINIIIRTKDDYLLISLQSDENDENRDKWVPSASGSLDFTDYSRNTNSFASLLYKGMFRELKEETGLDYRNNEDDIIDIHLLGYVRLLKKGGKPDFFGQCTINKTKIEIEKILKELKRTTEIETFKFISVRDFCQSPL